MAARFWVGGTGTWDASDTTHWSASSGGASGASVPGSSDDVTFDGSSGGGTATVNTDPTIRTLTTSAYTGTLDFSVNNNNLTLAVNTTAVTAFTDSGSGTHTIKMGNGTWTVQNAQAGTVHWNISGSNLTLTANSSTLSFTGAVGQLRMGGKTYSTVTIAANARIYFNASTWTIATLNLGAGALIMFNSATYTLSNAPTWAGTSSAPIVLCADGLNNATLSCASGTVSLDYGSIQDVTGSGGATFSATNSYGYNATNWSISGPSAGTGGFPVTEGPFA